MPTVDDVLKQCRTLAKDSRYSEAVELLSRAIADSPDARLYFRRGRCFEELDDPARAVLDYTSAIELNQTNPKYYFNRGMVSELALGQAREAIIDYLKAVEVEPAYVKAHQMCCLSMLLWTDLLEDAREHALTALRLAPDEALSHYCMGQVRMSAKEYDLAAESFARAVDLEPEEANHWSSLGWAQRNAGELNLSEAAYSRAIQLEPESCSYFRSRGSVRIKLGMVEAGVADLTHALTLSPTEADRLLIEASLANSAFRSGSTHT
jgi:tetratricopeptide (TPR) repeat protein